MSNNRILAVFGDVDDTNIPVENFMRMPPGCYELHIVLCYQKKEDGESYLKKTFPNQRVQVHPVRFPRLAYWVTSYLIGALVLIIKQVRPHIVHVHHTRTAYAGALAARLERSHVMLSLHSLWPRYFFWQRIFYGMAMFLSDRIVCNSHATLNVLPKWVHRYWSDRLRVCYNGVHVQRIQECKERSDSFWTRPLNGFVIGTAARLVGVKDLPTLLRGFARFREKTGSGFLVIAGDGPENSALQNLVYELGISQQVSFLGLLSRNQVYELLSQLDVYVVSSLYEGCCVGMLEAMAAELPVIATEIDSLMEISRGGAVMFPSGNYVRLAELLEDLYNKPNKRIKIGAIGHQHVKERLSLQNCIDCYMNLYDEMLHVSKPVGPKRP
jgi:glycosyltransferase involved in cell wall biosynthesis